MPTIKTGLTEQEDMTNAEAAMALASRAMEVKDNEALAPKLAMHSRTFALASIAESLATLANKE